MLKIKTLESCNVNSRVVNDIKICTITNFDSRNPEIVFVYTSSAVRDCLRSGVCLQSPIWEIVSRSESILLWLRSRSSPHRVKSASISFHSMCLHHLKGNKVNLAILKFTCLRINDLKD